MVFIGIERLKERQMASAAFVVGFLTQDCKRYGCDRYSQRAFATILAEMS